ncbi:ribonuclease HIII [Spiroplasma alleghenense]|uniref:Ribonuclease n=1 Tax=Spiroplasma alleghenense TaxID=216931 RepID=A0A345Z3V3_9MOLU|nr:ribonuclease HIII [Spiroplasma alleghenense]AXK51282.1 ribonuclease HIII [Spiroplasma alleghenense]
MAEKNSTISSNKMIGTDEVGVGDFFGPLVVVACYLDETKISNLSVFKKIKDSKQLSNESIMKIFEEIQKHVKYSVVMIDNLKYNNIYNKVKNSHVLKALGHNGALLDLIKNNPELEDTNIVIDEFVNKNKYFEYLKQWEKNIVSKNVNLVTKAESKFLAVACASIIARAYFLNAIATLQKDLRLSLPLGAGNEVKELVRDYKKNHPDKVESFIKMHFKDN